MAETTKYLTMWKLKRNRVQTFEGKFVSGLAGLIVGWNVNDLVCRLAMLQTILSTPANEMK
jgi:hypothetical protein